MSSGLTLRQSATRIVVGFANQVLNLNCKQMYKIYSGYSVVYLSTSLVPRPTQFFFCSSVSVDNNTRMRKGGEKRGCGRAAKNVEGLVSFITRVTSGGRKGGRRGGGA